MLCKNNLAVNNMEEGKAFLPGSDGRIDGDVGWRYFNIRRSCQIALERRQALCALKKSDADNGSGVVDASEVRWSAIGK